MEASGKTENFETVDDPMVNLWIRWMREGSQVPWTRVAIESFDPASEYPPKRFIRFSPFFHMLQQEDRERFLFSLEFTVTEKDDFLTCLYTVTSEEEEEVFKAYAQILLCYFLEWPMQSLFLETAQKMWKFIDDNLFLLLLNHIFLLKSDREDFCYSKLFEDFWYGSPNRLKEVAENDPSLREALSCLDKIASKRKLEDNEPTNSIKKKLV
ncbi:hypothetical protein AVEN_177578-1 [Araneus ventricosus]|uniref:Uncharacterized protein n=1 Tax=Araneus ventricosus TaxID=182803 RepID=A0A4Y2QPF5_ARAVE|nr:hypothetical protein AVEN_177578-1 [Araneus ventricosus]